MAPCIIRIILFTSLLSLSDILFYGAFSSLVVSKLFNSQYFHIIIITSQLMRRCFLKNIQMVSLHNNPNKWLCYWNIRIWKLFVWRLLKELRNQQTFSWQKTSIDWLKSKAFIVIVFFTVVKKMEIPCAWTILRNFCIRSDWLFRHERWEIKVCSFS